MIKLKASFHWFVKWLAQPLMVLIGLCAVAWSMGCGKEAQAADGEQSYVTSTKVGFVWIYHDARHEVTCWSDSHGICCLPDGHIRNPGE